MAAKIEVLNPVAQLASELGQFAPLAKRSPEIGKPRVGLYWNRKPGGNYALQALRDLLQERFDGIETHFFNARRPIPEEVVEEARATCDVVVGATAD